MAPNPSTSNGNPTPPSLSLNNQIMTKLKPAKIFKNAIDPGPPPQASGNQQQKTPPPPRSITGITFDDRGDQVVTAGEDETFRVYNCKTGKLTKTLYSKKYGVDLPRFTHKNSAIIYASTKEDDTIRYHSLHDNKYLQYFRGHKGKVVSLEVSPIDDGFMSGSLDKTVRLWDLRTPTCRGLLSLPCPPIVAYDSTGMVFAVAVGAFARILLYDQANFDKSPFLAVELNDPTLAQISYPPRPIFVTHMSFSADGKYLLLGCSGNAHYILDAFEGQMIAKLEGHIGLERRSLAVPELIEPAKGISGEEVSWTPDSKYVLGGSLDGRIFIWDVQNLQNRSDHDRKFPPMKVQATTILDGHPGPARCVKFNPRFAMMCTAGTELAFWLPDPAGESEETAKDLLKKKGVA
ncbi:WD40 repeat-like protein [Pholiota conissans]|uniref:WD40 repeat-like protein n=1 Tax=Pholiota conissans TaxID=109636 RepID=A0A9P6D5A4_9AGAR|nr:WD40 repeat-like protein [Pholiota conissans]